mmetsp:Transcript_14589/g.22517  ORF Transcript_14589/g.22517 Transcript_14589/m.22517 type:complete len:277 (+) Transcript_14589:120-950(+)|eukprot:CAMPEP_0196808986 /NCGR_PEP_ID=MMETSP1362-20130617/8961_1 /TAXON_ID=163516 /ORGANISM="Leptocylindrus danicus, Strain CCMP1856" /LENGTH=276 /DNA_ID=CAMNT_0042183515 /DNA_START=120 /DNA_END=950 /DNA_ORIENTATION=+
MLNQFVRRTTSLLVAFLFLLLPMTSSALNEECIDHMRKVEGYFLEREQYLAQDIDRLQQQIQRQSFRSAVLKFGRGPYFVEFRLDVPDVDGEISERSIVMRLAPLDIMPHSVHTFLELVSRNLYKDSTLTLAMEHLAYVDIAAKDGSKLGHVFRDAGDRDDFTPHTSFREYTEDHPHLPWTVGFIGSSGAGAGPEFYISVADNSLLHGPALDKDRANLPKKLDPCFAIVVAGRDVVRDVYSLPKDGFSLVDPVRISSCRILSEEEGMKYNDDVADL